MKEMKSADAKAGSESSPVQSISLHFTNWPLSWLSKLGQNHDHFINPEGSLHLSFKLRSSTTLAPHS